MMTMSPAALSAVGAAFAASLVEVVEAFTIILAVGTLRGWRPALAGTAAGLGVLAVIVLLLGQMLDQVPIHALQLVVGILLLLFGMGWLRKAALRHAGIIGLHDEEAIFAAEGATLRASPVHDWLAAVTVFKAVLLEGLEVVFIVVAVGTGRGMLGMAAVGAALACAMVLLVGVAVRRPLSRVPENSLKFGVGVMLSAFGVFWTGEGLGVDWPGGDLILFAFAGLFVLAGLVGAALARRPALEIAS